MNIRSLKIIGLALAAVAMTQSVAPVHAATPDEMERARTIAAQVYIRYQNDDAGYLDGKKPRNINELRNLIGNHESDSKMLDDFLRQPVSNDYPNWGEKEMEEYWGGTFFETANLSNKGATARNNKIISRIRTMDVTPPQATTEPEPVVQQPQQQPTEDLSAHPQEVTLGDQNVPQGPAIDTTQVTDETIRQTRESSSNTWIYIVLLIILVAIVIALVVYAMKAMRNQNAQKAGGNDTRFAGGAQSQYEEDEYNAQHTALNGEVERLRQQVADLRRAESDARLRAEQLSARVGALQVEVQRLSEENNALRSTAPGPRPGGAPVRPVPAPAPVNPMSAPGAHNPHGSYALEDEPLRPRPRTVQPAPAPNERVIYLGRANRQKVFVRADKQIVTGKSIYRLVTANGITGSFTVDTDPAIVGWVGLDPETALYGAAEVPTFANAASFTRIVTDAAGTAIFEDGCWKVLRPAAVHLE